MNWAIPNWWIVLLLGLASFRLWRLIAEDDITEPLRRRLPARILPFVRCAWCLGGWVAGLWWLAWVAWSEWSLVLAGPFAISAVIGLVAANIDPLDS